MTYSECIADTDGKVEFDDLIHYVWRISKSNEAYFYEHNSKYDKQY